MQKRKLHLCNETTRGKKSSVLSIEKMGKIKVNMEWTIAFLIQELKVVSWRGCGNEWIGNENENETCE